MGVSTEIFWCDSSFNTHWGCQQVSEGCTWCYAETLAKRWHRAEWGPPETTVRVPTSDNNWREPERWNARVAQGDTSWRKNWRAPVRPDTSRRLVFTNSMSDIFEHTAQLDPLRLRLWSLIERTPNLDWLLLTKRPQNIKRMLPQSWIQNPRPNVWLGTSTESQEWADKRIPHLLDVPAVEHFLSAEPLLGPLDLRFHKASGRDSWRGSLHEISWVITGGESGAHHRLMDPEWVTDIDAQCVGFGVPHFFKQHGGATHAAGGCLLRGVEVKEFPRTRLPIAA